MSQKIALLLVCGLLVGCSNPNFSKGVTSRAVDKAEQVLSAEELAKATASNRVVRTMKLDFTPKTDLSFSAPCNQYKLDPVNAFNKYTALVGPQGTIGSIPDDTAGAWPAKGFVFKFGNFLVGSFGDRSDQLKMKRVNCVNGEVSDIPAISFSPYFFFPWGEYFVIQPYNDRSKVMVIDQSFKIVRELKSEKGHSLSFREFWQNKVNQLEGDSTFIGPLYVFDDDSYEEAFLLFHDLSVASVPSGLIKNRGIHSPFQRTPIGFPAESWERYPFEWARFHVFDWRNDRLYFHDYSELADSECSKVKSCSVRSPLFEAKPGVSLKGAFYEVTALKDSKLWSKSYVPLTARGAESQAGTILEIEYDRMRLFSYDFLSQGKLRLTTDLNGALDENYGSNINRLARPDNGSENIFGTVADSRNLTQSWLNASFETSYFELSDLTYTEDLWVPKDGTTEGTTTRPTWVADWKSSPKKTTLLDKVVFSEKLTHRR